MNVVHHIKSLLQQSIDCVSSAMFYKTSKGGYAEHDQFIGVRVPTLRKIAKEYQALSFQDIQSLIESLINEERLLALLILIVQYQRGSFEKKDAIYQFYKNNLKYVNNWNLVDASAPQIMGAHLLHSNKDILLSLATSEVMWQRRIAIVSSWYFIRHNYYEWTIKIAQILLHDSHDLIHKSVGWMLREVGKRDINLLIEFLDQYATCMPRTMLRYAIEKFPEDKRKAYLLKKRH